MSINQVQPSINNIKMNQLLIKNNYSSSVESSTITEEPEKKTNHNKLYLTLGALAIIAVGTLYYRKSLKSQTTETSKNIPTVLTTKVPVEDYVEIFCKGMKFEEKRKFDKKLHDLEFYKLKIFDSVNNEINGIASLKCFISSVNAGLKKNAKIPNVIALENIPNSKTQDVSKIISFMFDSNYESKKYTKGYLKEFVENIEESSKRALDRYNEGNSHTILHIDNITEFLTDLNKKENETCKTRFNKLLNNSSARLTIVMNKDSSALIDANSKLSIKFNEKINEIDLKEDVGEFNHKTYMENIKKNLDIIAKMPVEINNITNALMDLLQEKPQINSYLADAMDKNSIIESMKYIGEATNNVFEKIDCKSSLKEIVPALIKKSEQNEDLYKRTGKRTILYLEDLDKSIDINQAKNSADFNKLKELIKDSEEKYHTIIVIKKPYNDNLSGLINDENSLLKIDFVEDIHNTTKSEQQVSNNTGKMINVNNIAEQKKRVYLEFISLVKMEKMNKISDETTDSSLIKNGILIYGDSKEKEEFINWITETAGVITKRFKHNQADPMKTINAIVNTSKEAEETFQKSNIRTLLVVDDLDKMLTDLSDDGIEMIGRFKGFVEHMSKDYHTTIIAKTDRSLDDFEPASIGQHRFGIKVNLKDENI